MPVGKDPTSEYPGWDSNPQHTAFETAPSAIGAPGLARNTARARGERDVRPRSCHRQNTASREWMERDSNPQDPKATGLQPATLPITCYPSVLAHRSHKRSDGDHALGGTRTHNVPILSRHPLPLGHQGVCGPRAPRALVFCRMTTHAGERFGDHASGGIRTHDIPILSRHPLPLGYRGIWIRSGRRDHS